MMTVITYKVVYKGKDSYGNLVFASSEYGEIHLSANAIAKYWDVSGIELKEGSEGEIISDYPDWFKDEYKCKWKHQDLSGVADTETPTDTTATWINTTGTATPQREIEFDGRIYVTKDWMLKMLKTMMEELRKK